MLYLLKDQSGPCFLAPTGCPIYGDTKTLTFSGVVPKASAISAAEQASSFRNLSTFAIVKVILSSPSIFFMIVVGVACNLDLGNKPNFALISSLIAFYPHQKSRLRIF